MTASRFSAICTLMIVGLGQGAMAQSVPDKGLCGWVLDALARDEWLGGFRAQRLLQEQTALLDLYNGGVPTEEPGAPYRAFYKLPGQPRSLQLDFLTTSAKRLGENCIKVDGRLGGVGNDDVATYVVRKDQSEFPVSIFVFSNGEFQTKVVDTELDARPNVRIKAAPPVLEPSLGETADGPAAFLDDFGVSAYISKQEEATIIGSVGTSADKKNEGTTTWLAADIGLGPQLVGVICVPDCKRIFDRTKEIPVFNPYAGGQTGSVDLPQVATVEDAPDFDRQQLVLLDELRSQTISTSDLWEKSRSMTDAVRAVLALKLKDLASADKETTQAALRDLATLGVIVGIDPEDWQVLGYEEQRRVILGRRGPSRLAGVTLKLKEGYDKTILKNCVPQLEIVHPGYSPYLVNFALDGVPRGGIYESLKVTLDQENPILRERPDTLSLRVSVPDDPASTCRLNWNSIFPDTPYAVPAMSEILPDSGFSMTPEGQATFAEVALTSTRRPVHLVLFNKTGPEDENNQQTDAGEYPVWNKPENTEDLQEALVTLGRVAQERLAEQSGGTFVVSARPEAGDTSFGAPLPLAATGVEESGLPLLTGRFGVESLRYAIEDAAVENALSPRLVVIGRTGLPEGSNYCAVPPEWKTPQASGTIVIDFVPRGAKASLLFDVDKAIENFEGPPEVAAAFDGFPAAQCPPTEGVDLVHWVLLPDGKKRSSWRPDLETIATYIFGGVK